MESLSMSHINQALHAVLWIGGVGPEGLMWRCSETANPVRVSSKMTPDWQNDAQQGHNGS